jgi:hypothetical protein
MLVTGFSVLLGALLNVLVARQGLHELSQKSAREIEGGLNEANREYLTNHLGDTAQQVNLKLGHAYADLRMLAAIMQTMVDQGDQLDELHKKVASTDFFRDKLVYNSKSNWWQNGPDEPGRRQTGRRGEAPVRREKGALPLLPTALGRSGFADATRHAAELTLVERLNGLLGLHRLCALGAEQALEE